jgi:aconitase A
MKEIAEKVAEMFFAKFEKELHDAMVHKIVNVGTMRWRDIWFSDNEISKLINEAIKDKFENKYRPVLDFISDKKAKERVIARAKKNGLTEEEISPLFEMVTKTENK